jgi:hypothetical protein
VDVGRIKMLSAYDCAVLSEDVYQSTTGDVASKKGWSSKKDFTGHDGFYGALYNKGRQYVVAYRGTNDLKDVKADLNMAIRVPPSQSKHALEFYSKCSNSFKNITAVTGHSLGGALAKIVSQRKNILAIDLI